MNINGIEITHGLIIDDPWIGKILSGEKTWEMRSTKTKIRGKIALIKKGSGLVVGTCELANSLSCDPDMLHLAVNRHCITDRNLFKKWNVAWRLRDAKPIDPIPYTHKQGAVIWVKL